MADDDQLPPRYPTPTRPPRLGVLRRRADGGVEVCLFVEEPDGTPAGVKVVRVRRHGGGLVEDGA